jgi:hypothetical protein
MPSGQYKKITINGTTMFIPEHVTDIAFGDITDHNKVKMSNFNVGITKVDETVDKGYFDRIEGRSCVTTARRKPWRNKIRMR